MVTTKGLSTMKAHERRKARVPQAVFLLLVFLGFLQARNFAAAMPGVMATHFGASGAANGWQTKGQFFIVEIVMLAVCLLISFGIPAIIAGPLLVASAQSRPKSGLNLDRSEMAGTIKACYFLVPRKLLGPHRQTN